MITRTAKGDKATHLTGRRSAHVWLIESQYTVEVVELHPDLNITDYTGDMNQQYYSLAVARRYFASELDKECRANGGRPGWWISVSSRGEGIERRKADAIDSLTVLTADKGAYFYQESAEEKTQRLETAKAKELRDRFYAEQIRLEQLNDRSTAWNALMRGMENADDTVGEGDVVADSAAYWELAWSGYESNMDELPAEDRDLSEGHNLDNLTRCGSCGCAVVDPQPYEDGLYCDECLEEVSSEAVYGTQEPLSDGQAVAFREGFSGALEGAQWLVRGGVSTDPEGKEFVVIGTADGASRLAWVADLVRL